MTSTIGQSTVYNDNFTNRTHTSKLIGESITDGVATFSGGTITNLVNPTNLQDAVTKGFVDRLYGVAPPLNSVQFNNLTFDGSANLTFVPDTLNVNGIIEDGSGITITAGVISGLADPVEDDQIATKNYVDLSSSSTTNNYIQSDTAVTYTAEQMINGIILRNLATDNDFGISLTDTTATAAELVAFVPTASVGYVAKFKICNNHPDANGTTIEARDNFVLRINPGAGVTFFPSDPFELRRSYMLDAYIRFTNIVTPAVTIIINSCVFAGSSFYLSPTTELLVLPGVVDYINYNAAYIEDNVIWNLTDNTYVTSNYSYTTADIKNQLIVRNPAGNASDTFGFNISPRYLNQIITIQNISAFLVDISGQTNIWNLIPNPISIPAGYQTTLSTTLETPDLTSAGSNYDIGVYNTSGGTGSGLTVTILVIATTSSLISGGTGYSVGNYTTTNITTPSATGLIVYCGDISAGIINGYNPIVNYLYGGYQNGDIIQINGGNDGARIQLNLVNCVTSYYINTLGNGAYVSSDVLTISGPGTGSGAQITLGVFINVRTIGLYEI